MSTLPTEIVDHIFSFLDVLSHSEYNDLKACAEAHPFLLKSAERYLFSDIRLHSEPFTNGRAFNCSQFSDVLRNKPHVANYVYALGLDLGAHGLDWNLKDMLFIMSKLPRPKTIEIKADPFLRWSTLSKPFCEAFMNCLGLPSITKVSIVQTIDFPMITFGQCKGLVELSLDGIFDFSSPSRLSRTLD